MLTPAVSDRDHIQGLPDAVIVLVEYGDYECPYCGAAYPVVKELQHRLKGKLALVFRNFPLANAHPHAEFAAEAAEAAAAQGKFWEMHDMLYENQQALEPENLVEYATTLGLDIPRFKREMNEHVYTSRVKDDFAVEFAAASTEPQHSSSMASGTMARTTCVRCWRRCGRRRLEDADETAWNMLRLQTRRPSGAVGVLRAVFANMKMQKQSHFLLGITRFSVPSPINRGRWPARFSLWLRVKIVTGTEEGP